MKFSRLHILIGPALILLSSSLLADELLLRVQREEAFSNSGYRESRWFYAGLLSKKLEGFSLAADLSLVKDKSQVGLYRGQFKIQDWLLGGLKNSVSFGDGDIIYGELAGHIKFRGIGLDMRPAQNETLRQRLRQGFDKLSLTAQPGRSGQEWQLKTFGGLIQTPQAGRVTASYGFKDRVWGADFQWKPFRALQLREYFSQRQGTHNLTLAGTGANLNWRKFSLFFEVSGCHRPGFKNNLGFAYNTGLGYAQDVFFSRVSYLHFDSTFANLVNVSENPKAKDRLSLSLGLNFERYLQLNISGFSLKSIGRQRAGTALDYSQGGSGLLRLSLPSAPAASFGYEAAYNEQTANDSLEFEIFKKENTVERIWAELSKDLKFAALSGRYQDRKLLPRNDSLGLLSKEREWEAGLKSGQWKGCWIYFGYVWGKRNQAFGLNPAFEQPWSKYKANLGLSPIKALSLNLQAELLEEKEKTKSFSGSLYGAVILPYSFMIKAYYRPTFGLGSKTNNYKSQYLSVSLERRANLSSDEIKGNVFIDANKNGKREREEKGISGIRVKANGQGETVTDNQGKYRFVNLKPKAYDVQMDLATLPADYTPISPLVQTVSTGGLTSRKADFAVSVLGTVKGRVFIDENNNGIFDDGETGVSEVTVVLKPEGLIAISNGNGLFRFSNVPVSEHYANLDISSLPPDYVAEPKTFKFKVGTGQEIEGLNFPVKRLARTVKKVVLSPIEGVKAASAMQKQAELAPPPPRPGRKPAPPPGPKASPQEIESLIKRATSLYTSEKYEEAVALWKKILRLDPGNSKAQKNLKRTLAKLKAMRRGR
ncbi:hypothetical protein HY768_09565 [candidate division TA06 bacterium]|uniref:SD-repeat containing protein B domain-containing protein n=1 Tax=candidate division TA06 bacterium TaxID=2250710 RepID=A0A933MK85_UNCT6|nr:hypothetical protein [candidate division TA06 bacterium]